MCLVVIAFDAHAEYDLVVAGNRDEFHARPTLDANWWIDEPDIVGGRDLEAGGTWLAAHRDGRFATVTNLRGVAPRRDEPRSRGHLVTDFLRGESAALDYLRGLDPGAYNGFNLLVGSRSELAFCSNQGDEPRSLPAGIYSLGNERIGSGAAKVRKSGARLQQLVAADMLTKDTLLALLDDREGSPPTSAPFVVQDEFGTRSSTIVTAHRSGDWRLFERRFDARGEATGDTDLAFRVGVHA